MKAKLMIFLLGIILLPALAQAGDYIIGEGDVLEVSVWGVKDLNVSVKVRPDGKITIPGLGDVKVTDVTPSELQKTLGTKLKELVKNPIVTVTVRDINNSKVYVFGGGVNSGVYDLSRRTNLLQLLCMIGTPATATGTPTGGTVSAASTNTQAADYKKAYVLRNGKKVKEDFYNLFINGDTSENIMIESNDMIFIPPLVGGDKNVYVLGAVSTPRFIGYRPGMTVMEAILESGGFTKFAKQNDTVILRKEGNKDVSITVRAKDLINDGDLSQNVKLKPGDYIIVAESLF